MKRNVLIIPPFNPYPLTSGGHQGIFNGIAMLKDIANVCIVIDCTETQYNKGILNPLKMALPWVNVVPFILPESKHTFGWYLNVLKNKLHGLFSGKPDSTTSKIKEHNIDCLPSVRNDKKEYINHLIEKYHIDIVQVEMCAMMEIVTAIPTFVKKVFVHHELHFVRNELQLRKATNATKEDWKIWEQEKQKEIGYLNQYDIVVTLSETDYTKLKEAGVSTRILPSFAVVTTIQNTTMNYPIQKKLSFIGPESHLPNYDGVMWFLHECWEKLCAMDSDWSFQIIGIWSNETAEYIHTHYKNVQCLGFVEDLQITLAGTTMIVPIRIGSGIRMKILEAAQLSIPVVTTTIGAEGLPVHHNTHVYIADDADDFIKGIIALQDNKTRKMFVEATADLIANRYSLDALIENRKGIYLI